ncbi:MAG: cell division protein FtsZ [Halobacteria archaeon]
MDAIVQEAIVHSEKEQINKSTSESDFDDFSQPKIVVVGVGGAGNNSVNRLHSLGIAGAETIAINTDANHLKIVQADKKVLIGALTKGLGAGGNPEIAEKSAELGKEAIARAIGKADLVFITAGMGGGTGTGASPVVAQIAREIGAIVIAMVSMPFAVERGRIKIAEMGLKKLKEHAHTVIVLSNDGLVKLVPNQPIEQALNVMDHLIADTIKGISESITQPSLINIDYADVKAIAELGGVGTLLVGEAKGRDKAQKVVKSLLSNPLMNIDIKGGKGCLLHIIGGPDLTLEEANDIAEEFTRELDPNANVIWGARIRKGFDDRVRIMAIVNGIAQEAPQLVAAVHGPVIADSPPLANLTFSELREKNLFNPEPVTIAVNHFVDKYSRILWIIGLFFLGIIALAGLFYISQWFK